MELYKKYRPRALRAVVGAEETVASLQNMITKKTVPHAILFHGPSGCGKTTLARILKSELGCSDWDFQELNCSDFRGIETVRDIARTMNLAPTAGACRIWLLDEVHQMSKDGQNAALKILEDTPAHVYFVLCTTDPQKVLKTIRNRCMEMAVRSLTVAEMGTLVDRVCRRESLTIEKEIRDYLIQSAQGSARVALVLLDKISHLETSQQKEAIEARLAEESEAIELCRLLMKKAPWPQVAAILKNLKGEAEATRYVVLGYARVCLLNSPKPDHQAYKVIFNFQQNFYDGKDAALAAACFQVIHGD